MRRFFHWIWNAVFLDDKCTMQSTMLMVCEIVVANAADHQPQWNTPMNSTSSTMFVSEDSNR